MPRSWNMSQCVLRKDPFRVSKLSCGRGFSNSNLRWLKSPWCFRWTLRLLVQALRWLDSSVAEGQQCVSGADEWQLTFYTRKCSNPTPAESRKESVHMWRHGALKKKNTRAQSHQVVKNKLIEAMKTLYQTKQVGAGRKQQSVSSSSPLRSKCALWLLDGRRSYDSTDGSSVVPSISISHSHGAHRAFHLKCTKLPSIRSN